MPLPDFWIDRLFERLTLSYGVAFDAQYRDLDLTIVKANWANELSGCSGDAIAHALEHMPTDKPPNVLQFRALCRNAPVKCPPALPAPKADPERVEQAIAKVAAKPLPTLSPARLCIENIEAAANRKLLTPGQRHVLAACKAMVEVSA